MSERSPAMDIADLIRDSEAGWAVYVGNEAPAPDDAVTFYDTGGGQSNADGPLYDQTIQVRVRSRSYADGYTKALAIRDLLMIRTARDIGNWHYTGFWLVSDVAKIGRDDSDRELFTVNFRLMRERVPPAPSCTVTLTSEDAAGFGAQPWPVISGATASIPSMAAGTAYWVATTPLASAPVVDWSGVRAIQARITAMSASPSNGPSFWCVKLSNSDLCQVFWGGTQWVVEAFGSVSGILQTGITDSSARVTWLVDGTSGDLSFVIGSMLVTKDTTPTSGSMAMLSGMFAGGTEQLYTGCRAQDSAGGKSVSIEYYPSGADMTPFTAPAGTKDWCGNTI